MNRRGAIGDEVATSTYAYATLGRLTDLAYKNGGTNLFTPYEWTFDNLNRITQFVSADGTSEEAHTRLFVYTTPNISPKYVQNLILKTIRSGDLKSTVRSRE